jgi:signal transduction histidine kinase/CheY-like chemotaxis protein
MVSGGEVIGVVSTVRSADQVPFGPADLETADIIVPAIAAGVHVSQLFADLRTANEKLARASQVKSEFLANMSHELRTPLNSILGFSELLIDAQDGLFDAKTRAEFLRNINTSGQHLLGLINDILDLAKVEAGRMEVRPEPLDFGAAIEEVLDSMAALALAKNIRVQKQTGSGLDLVADPRLVRQILINLVSNAIKFTPTGGTVTLAAEARESTLELAVTDTGVGIGIEDQERIFGEFEQVSGDSGRGEQGTGLGLALTRRMLALQGGRIWVESEPGMGATFRVELPLRPQVMTPPEPALASASPPAVDAPELPLVLVIEDDSSAASLISHQLQAGGFRPVVAKDGRQALEMARTLAPAAITLDVILPELDGWEVLRTLKVDSQTRDIPVVVVSVLDDKVTGRALGAADYFVKPVDPRALLEGLARIGLTTGITQRAPKVLVVDDEPHVLDLMSRVLEPKHFTVLRAGNGPQAIEIARQELPDAILLDLLMPEMSGLEVIAVLKADSRTAAIPILIVTSKDLTQADRDELNGSVASVLNKGSFAAVDVVHWLKQAMGTR